MECTATAPDVNGEAKVSDVVIQAFLTAIQSLQLCMPLYGHGICYRVTPYVDKLCPGKWALTDATIRTSS